jgi:ubiquinol-cytochrome c reductase cytochrome b subunit
VVLGWLGAQSGSDTQKLVAQILTAYYFLFFFSMPFWSRMGRFKAVPDRVPAHD